MSLEFSFVLPVYNKATLLPDVIEALGKQTLGGKAEYIFVDDASTDDSLSILQQARSCLSAVSIIPNQDNLGPSIRVNQGAKTARGRYLCLIDADEMIVPDAVATMWRLLQKHDARMAHGKCLKTGKSRQPIRALSLNREYEIFDDPLADILGRRGIVRMTWLIETALFHAAGGCDERVFIQDESLPLRLALHARRMINFKSPMTYAPLANSHLSSDDRQQHHDRFFTYYHFLQDQPHVSKKIRRLLAQKCLSMAWKSVRGGELRQGWGTALFPYIGVKTGIMAPRKADLDSFRMAFLEMDSIRRMGEKPASTGS